MNPLVAIDRGAGDVRSWEVAVTDEGRRVCARERQWPEVHRIDRWLAGVHLGEGMRAWRWSEGARRLV